MDDPHSQHVEEVGLKLVACCRIMADTPWGVLFLQALSAPMHYGPIIPDRIPERVEGESKSEYFYTSSTGHLVIYGGIRPGGAVVLLSPSSPPLLPVSVCRQSVSHCRSRFSLWPASFHSCTPSC